MNKWLVMFFIVTTASVEAGGTDEKSFSGAMGLCTDHWVRFIEENLPTGDGRGHGPDVGSDEWKSVVEFNLGILDNPGVPKRESEAWCHHIDQIVQNRRASQVGSEVGPSFACDKVERGSMEAVICGDEELSSLDRKLSGIYAAALRTANNEHPPLLKAEQRGWIKGRDECWKSDDKRECVRDEYIRRSAELQARYRLVPYSGPVSFICDDNPANEIVAMFFQTDPSTLIAERGDSVSLMYMQPSASGSKYQGRNETFWEHHGEAMISWGYNAPEMHCKIAPRKNASGDGVID